MAQAQKKEEAPMDKESISFSAEISKVLQLMIHSLYTNKDIFLRELISNASDACDKLRYEAQKNAKLMGDDGELAITIRSDENSNTVEISDNGIGMNRDDLIANLGTIAKSGTMEFFESLSGNSKSDAHLIGQFGVGFYSAFMVADKVEVHSRKAGEDGGWIWTSEGGDAFTVEASSEELSRGTTIILYLNDDAKEYADRFRLNHIITTYSDHISVPIFQINEEGEKDQVNKGSALWARPKSDISEEQYQEFYHHVSHSPDEPWLTMHSKAEGMIEYTSLLYVPTNKPFDLFHPERRRRVKLYVKRVFITEENIDLVPQYLRFLRGVIDSEDLPLNISRETLQDNPILRKIRESITSKVLTELEKKAEKDPEGFAAFWESFGAVLKEGLCEALPQKERDKLLKVCRFYSTRTNGMVSLDEYLEHMKDGQNEIYFHAGDSLEAVKQSPQIEGFVSRGIEVLLFTDHVDDFWVNVVGTYQEKPFKSVTKADADLDSLAQKEDVKEDADKDAKATDEEAINNLMTLFGAIYGDEIKEVRTTTKLTDTPACLAADAGAMDFRMERFLMEHKQLPKRAAKILEINAKHPLVALMAEQAKASGQSDALTDAAQLLLDQAKIIEGEPIEDAAGFARRLSGFMQRGFAS